MTMYAYPLQIQATEFPKASGTRYFFPFYTTKERGTGLGLAIVHKIVVSHGGDIKVETGDKGTTFTIRFPKRLDCFLNRSLFCCCGILKDVFFPACIVKYSYPEEIA